MTWPHKYLSALRGRCYRPLRVQGEIPTWAARAFSHRSEEMRASCASVGLTAVLPFIPCQRSLPNRRDLHSWSRSRLSIGANDRARCDTSLAQAQINGVEGTEMIGDNAARAMEGELSCVGALWSPETGIIDSHSYMRALWGELEDRGGMIAFATLVERMSLKAHPIMNRKSDWVLQLRCRTQPFSCL
jgi:glycine/D-amino acid oxidase-like deaminating enzyme